MMTTVIDLWLFDAESNLLQRSLDQEVNLFPVMLLLPAGSSPSSVVLQGTLVTLRRYYYIGQHCATRAIGTNSNPAQVSN